VRALNQITHMEITSNSVNISRHAVVAPANLFENNAVRSSRILATIDTPVPADLFVLSVIPSWFFK